MPTYLGLLCLFKLTVPTDLSLLYTRVCS